VGNEATVLGFIGAPYTMATYCVEGGTSASYLQIKKMGCVRHVHVLGFGFGLWL
jgi:uroporphyrinogen-III decarboxylase